MNEKHHVHWEVDSVCPNGHINHINIPEGEEIVTVVCKTHGCGKTYTHLVREHQTVEDDGGKKTLN